MSASKTSDVKIVVNIVPGKGTMAQRHAWRQFWGKLAAQAREQGDQQSG